MREILFRAKRIDNGELIEGCYVKLCWNGKEMHEIIQENTEMYSGNTIDSIIDIDPETLCQFTGSNDKNGNRIWENDIVSFIDMTSTESGYCERNCIGRVAWDIEEACFYVTDRLSSESWEVLQDCYAVGNIFDNPELLKGE